MNFQGWAFPSADSAYSTNTSNSPFSTNVSSFFRRPSKVVKPGSRNTSPRYNGRRKTTSNAPISRTRSLRSTIQHQLPLQPKGRPLSWHPRSIPDFAYASQGLHTDTTHHSYPQFLYGTTASNGLITPMSYPLPDEPQIQELISPLEELSAQEPSSLYQPVPYGYQYWTPPQMGKEQNYVMDNMFPQQQQMMAQNWQYNSQYMSAKIPTAPASPAFLPIQGGLEASPLSLDTRPPPLNTEGEELIGMGLYDSPEDVRRQSDTTTKRPLKLEESFEPPPESSDAEEETEDEEDEVDDELELPIHQNQPVQPVSSMAGQTFFFDSSVDANAAVYGGNMAFVQDQRYQMQYPGYTSWL